MAPTAAGLAGTISPAPVTRNTFRTASLRTGGYEFIPLPFLDDWLIGRERRKVVRTILAARGLSHEDKAVRILAGSGRTLSERLHSFAKGLFLKPMRKVFRTLFFWLTLRRAARNVVATYFLARFLHHPELGTVCGNGRVSVGDARRLAAIFESVSRNIDLRALRGVVRKVRLALSRPGGSEVDRRDLRTAIESQAPGFIEEFDWLVATEIRESAR